MTAAIMKLEVPYDGVRPAAKPEATAPKRIRTKITFQKERFPDIWMELPNLWKQHHDEIAVQKETARLAPDIGRYLTLDMQGILHITTARTGSKRLVGYAFDLVTTGLHYCKTKESNCDLIWLHPSYRIGKGLSIRKHPGFRLLQARERMLDELKVERRKIDSKLHREFGGLLKLLGYRAEAVVYLKSELF